jgi:hypothetical protein
MPKRKRNVKRSKKVKRKLPKRKATSAKAGRITPAQARAIARDAYVYGFPMVDSYRIQYAYFMDRDSPEYKAPWNQIRNMASKKVLPQILE